jgi:hypothetical protein
LDKIVLWKRDSGRESDQTRRSKSAAAAGVSMRVAISAEADILDAPAIISPAIHPASFANTFLAKLACSSSG